MKKENKEMNSPVCGTKCQSWDLKGKVKKLEQKKRMKKEDKEM